MIIIIAETILISQLLKTLWLIQAQRLK